MPKGSRPSWQHRRYAFVVGLAALALVLALTISCTDSSHDVDPAASTTMPAEGGLVADLFLYAGNASLDERIAGSDVIARVRMRSVSPAADLVDIDDDATLDNVSALEYRFQALEYLKGSGGGELVAVVYDPRPLATSQSATTNANALVAERDTQWDGREAIVFLEEGVRQRDRYVLGSAFTGDYNPLYKDVYTIASIHSKNWLPAASAGGSRNSDGNNQAFLLDVPGSGADGESTRSVRTGGTTPTITKADLKVRLAKIEAEIANGGGSQAYRDCVYEKYTWEREVRSQKEARGGDYFYHRFDEALASGLPTETLVYTSLFAGYMVEAYGQTPPTSNWGEYRLVGDDEDLFHPRWPGVAVTARPLPADEYRFYYAFRSPRYVICDAHPEEELKRFEIFVTVTAPAGAVHEALFDPAAIGTAVGADAANGVVEPAGFTVGGTATTVQALKWESGVVTMELSAAASLSGYDMDVIELDGSTSLTLSVADATSNAGGTLTWDVANQPWHDGDQLMLRLRTA